MTRLTPSIVALLMLAGCPSGASTSLPIGGPEPVPQTDAVPPLLPAPAPVLTNSERELISDLTMAMYVDEFEVRRLAAEELGTIGPDARGAMPELIRCAAADKDEEPVASCAHSIILVADASDTHALATLVYDFQLPLATKERALSALGELGGLATPAIATIYLDACVRGASATTAAAAEHLDKTARMALGQLARSPASARSYLSDERHGACGQSGAEAVSVIAAR